MTAPYFGESPDDELKRRLRSQMTGSVAPQVSVTDQVFQSLNRAKDELAQRIAALSQPQAPVIPDAPQGFTPQNVGDATVERSPSFVQRLGSLIASPRFESAVEGFSHVADPTANGVEGFLGSAAEAFTGSRRAQHTQEAEAEARTQRDRLLGIQEAKADRGTTPSVAKYGAPRWIPNPANPEEEIQVVQNPTTGLDEPKTFNGQRIVRPRQKVEARPRNIDPNSPEGIAAAVERARRQADVISKTTPNAAVATTRAFATRAQDALPSIESIVVPDNTEYEVGRRSPVEAGKSQTYRQWRTKALQFIYPILRKETGAAISNQEFDDAVDMYIPKPGDGPDVLAQKKSNREAAVRSLHQMGNQAGPDDPYAGLH